jgi:hypothetical protein
MTTKLEAAVDAMVEGRGDPSAETVIRRAGSEALRILEPRLVVDRPLDELESVEAVLKLVLRALFAAGPCGEVAREIAAFQQRVSFLLKYKSYAVKAASPLGYSVFIQNPGEGFSFQRHTEVKLEVFHILDVHDGGFVFMCEYDDWRRSYEPASFAAWLAGAADDRYERFRFRPEAGDVFHVDHDNVVHTVIGCTVEEFATVSTDMVERLHDQNRGKQIPPLFGRAYARSRLCRLPSPGRVRLVSILPGGPRVVPAMPVAVTGGWQTTFVEGPLAAQCGVVEPGQATAIARDASRAIALNVTQGSGRLVLGDREETRRASPPTLPIQGGDLLLVAPGAWYGIVNDAREALRFSRHGVQPQHALR